MFGKQRLAQEHGGGIGLMLEHAWSEGRAARRALNVHSGLRYYLGLGRVSEGVKSMEGSSDGVGRNRLVGV